MSAVAVARPTADERIKAALWFAEHGFGVFSVWSTTADGVCRCSKGRRCDNAGKHPIGDHGFKDATSDPARIRLLLSAGSEPNYGLVCPDGVFALDVDGEGVQQLAELEQEHGPLPPTLRTETANGEHVFLRWPEAHPRPMGQMFGYVTRWGSGSDAGYVIGPRSVHASGAVYTPAGQAEIGMLPEAWAIAVVQPTADDDDGLLTVTSGGYELPDYGYTGSRYKAILKYVASRYMRGLSKDEIYSGVESVLLRRFAHPITSEELRSRFERTWKKTAERLGDPIDFEATDQAGGATPAYEPSEWPAPPDPAVYHGVLGSIVRAVAEHTEADPVGILGSLLAIVGACMGHWQSIYQGSVQSTNLFVVLVGDSSVGRKGTAGSIAYDAMTSAYPEWKQLIVAGLGSGEGLIGHLKRTEKTEHRAIVLESELGRLLTTMAREGSTLSPVVRDAWDGVPMGRFLAKESALVTWHHVGIVGHITSVELRAKLTNVDAANGFGNRFLWLAVRRSKLLPFPESPTALIQPYVRRLREAIEAAQSPKEIPWSEAARTRWAWLYTTLASRRRYGLWGAMVARGEAQIVRLALLYALLDQSDEIEPEHLTAAEALWEYSERSVVQFLGYSTGDRDADSLRDLLVDGPLDWDAAKRALGLRKASDMQEAVDQLIRLDLVEVVTAAKTGGGRPKRHLQLVGLTAEQTMQTNSTAGTEPRGENTLA